MYESLIFGITLKKILKKILICVIISKKDERRLALKSEYTYKTEQFIENGSDFHKTRIAAECGFYDLSHMEKTIKRK